jgi:sugar O-acyltransferase (sialic acid O-acetyltransferase NeuD family)
MSEQLVIVGAGGFGRETHDVVEAVNASFPEAPWEIAGVVDDAPSELNLRRLLDRSIRFLGPLEKVPQAAWVALGVGSPQSRVAIHARLAGRCAGFATLVHPTAVIGSSHVVGEGSIVCAYVSVGTNVSLGSQVHLNPHAVIGHDTQVGDFVSVNPNATVSGECVLHREVLVGASAVVLQGICVGVAGVVGAAACVTKSVPGSQIFVGVPARQLNAGVPA